MTAVNMEGDRMRIRNGMGMHEAECPMRGKAEERDRWVVPATRVLVLVMPRETHEATVECRLSSAGRAHGF